MDMQKILEYRNARNRFCQRIGITVTELSPGYAKVVKTVTEDDLNPVDVAHGGLLLHHGGQRRRLRHGGLRRTRP